MGLITIIAPITASIFLVGIIFIANKLGMNVPNFLLEPIFNGWIICSGVVIGFCLCFKQIFLMLAIIIVSGLAVAFYYLVYVM